MSTGRGVVAVVRKYGPRPWSEEVVRHVKLDDEEISYTGPGADEKVVDSMAKLVVECLKEDDASVVRVRGWSGIGRSRVMDRVVGAFLQPTSLQDDRTGAGRAAAREDHFCAGCVRVAVDPYFPSPPEYEIRGKVEQLLEMRPLLAGNSTDADRSFWRRVATTTFNWKPLVVIVENLQEEIDIDKLGIPSYVKDNEGVRHAFMKIALTCYTDYSSDFILDWFRRDVTDDDNHPRGVVQEVDSEFDDLPEEVAYQMVLYEASSAAAASINRERLQSLLESRYKPEQERLTGMMLIPSLAPVHIILLRISIMNNTTNIEENYLTGEVVIHILSYFTLLPPSSFLPTDLLLDYLRSDNVTLPYVVGNAENSWDETILLASLFHDFYARSLLEIKDNFVCLPSRLKHMLVALASSSSSNGYYLLRHSERSLEQVDMSQWNKDLTKISFAHNQMIREILLPKASPLLSSSVSSPNFFPILSTLILRDNPTLEEIPDDIFRYMSNLRVLDLSYCISIKTLPSSLSCLWNLRMLSLSNCEKLQTIGTVGLDNLEVLDLNKSPLARLEKAPWCHMRNLKRLKFRKGLSSLQELQLSLRNVRVFDEHRLPPKLPKPQAPCLQKFNISILHPEEEKAEEEEIRRRRTRDVYFRTSRFPYEHIRAQFDRHMSTTTKSVANYPIVREGFANPRDKCLEINGGEGLWSLYTLVGMFRPQLLSLHNYLNAQQGMWPTVELKDCYIKCCNDMEYAFNSPNPGKARWMDHLEGLEILWLSSNTKLAAICNDRFSLQERSFGLLKSIYLEYCPNLLVLFPVPVSLPKLQVMEIRFCSLLQNLFTAEHGADVVLPKIERLHLCQLPKLRSICTSAVQLPSLQKLEVRGCLNLRTVPFSSPDCRRGVDLVVRGEEEWWKNVQGFNKLEHVAFKAGFDSAAPKHIPSRWKRGPRRRRPRPVIRGS